MWKSSQLIARLLHSGSTASSAKYLLLSFERLWAQGVDAQEWIDELLRGAHDWGALQRKLSSYT
jgi:hypothetical protein